MQEEECVSHHNDLPADPDAVAKDAPQQDPPQQQHILGDQPQQLEEQEQLQQQQQQKPTTLQPRENTLENVAKIVRVR